MLLQINRGLSHLQEVSVAKLVFATYKCFICRLIDLFVVKMKINVANLANKHTYINFDQLAAVIQGATKSTTLLS